MTHRPDPRPMQAASLQFAPIESASIASRLTKFRANASAREVDAALRATLEEIRRAEGHAVLWFAEVNRRRLYRDLGYGSIHQYAEDRLGFSRPRTAQFLKLAESLDTLSLLRASLVAGRTTWTKVRTVVGVATPKTEAVWRVRVETMGRRDLEIHVARVRAAADHRRKRRGQARLPLTMGPVAGTPAPAQPGNASGPVTGAPGRVTGANTEHGPAGAASVPEASAAGPTTNGSAVAGTGSDLGESAGGSAAPGSHPALFDDPAIEREAAEVPVTVTLRLSPVQAARYEALREKARKVGLCLEVADLVLAGLEELVESERFRLGLRTAGNQAGARGPACPSVETEKNPESVAIQPVTQSVRRVPRGTGSPYEIHLAVCPECERGRVQTNRGSRGVGLPELRAAACDARVRGADGTNRSTIPPRLRRQVLDRDGHRCQAAACGGTRFLEVHHRIPRSRGGSNRPDNLITLCSACHRATHVHEPGDDPLRN